eukprot:scaffold14290_cov125-Isochrysis_galbana.AAC.15
MSFASGRRDRAAPRRTRLTGTAASPSLVADMNSQPSGAVSGGRTSVLPNRPTMPPMVMPSTDGMKTRRSSLATRRGKASSHLIVRPRISMRHGNTIPEGAMKPWRASASDWPAERAIGRAMEANKLGSSTLPMEELGGASHGREEGGEGSRSAAHGVQERPCS